MEGMQVIATARVSRASVHSDMHVLYSTARKNESEFVFKDRRSVSSLGQIEKIAPL